MLVALYILGIVAGLLRKKSKFVRAYQFIITWILFAFNSNNTDMEMYKLIYFGQYGDAHEIGFEMWRHLFSDNGVPFEIFWITSTTIILFAIYKFSKMLFCEVHNGAMSIIMVFPLLNMVITLRSSIAIAIVFSSIVWFLKCDTKQIKNKILYTILILFATSFHYSSLFFLVVLTIREELPSNKTLVKAFGITLFAVVILNLPFFTIILNIVFHSNKALNWFDSANRIKLGFILVVGMHMAEFLIVLYSYQYRSVAIVFKDSASNSVEKKIYSINIYSMFLIGFYTFNMEFFARIYCVVIMLNSLNFYHMLRKYKNNRFALHGVILQIAYVLIIFVIIYGGRNYSTILDIFRNNSLISIM